MFDIAISIREALKLPTMKKTKLVAGSEGINKQIKWVTVVEVLEDIERIQEGEFLITTGFNLTEDKERMKIFHDLLRFRPLSGVAIYTSFYMDKIPASFIELADKHQLPLIEIPTDINFSEITKEILKKIINKQTYLLEQSEQIHSELTTLILNDQSLNEVTKRLAKLTEADIYIYNEFYDISYRCTNYIHHESITNSSTTFTINGKEVNILNHLLGSLKKEYREHITIQNKLFTIFPIIAKQSCYGWIVMIKSEKNWQELNDIAIERAISIYAMEFLKQQAVEEAKLRIQNDLLEDIFSNNYRDEQFIIDQALKLNYDLTLSQCVFHLTFEKTKKSDTHFVNKLYQLTTQLLNQKNKQHMIQTKTHSIMLLTNVNGKTEELQNFNIIQLANDLQSEWHYNFPKVKLTIGIGRLYDNLNNLGKSAREAYYAVKLKDLVDCEKTITHYGDLGSYDLLLNMHRTGIDLSSVYREIVNALIPETDREINLIETFEVYFKNNLSIQRTAEKLYIHRHTLRYRLNQIEKRTGLDLKLTEDILKLQLGVMAYKLTNVLDKKVNRVV